MRYLVFVALMACGSMADDDADPPRLVIAGGGNTFKTTSLVGIDCGSGGDACDVELPATADVGVSIVNNHPESCYFWTATVMPTEAGSCTVSGTQGSCTLHIDRTVTVSVGNCYNP